jgi:uncharacterized membrane protein YgdD (TMEM256/DUF423 family)
LYLLTLLKFFKGMDLGIFGLLTPLGGLLLVSGWLSLMLGVPAIKPVSND